MIIGLDVGGTHTDVVLIGENGLEREVKVPTNSRNLFDTVLTGLEKILDGIDSDKIERAVLSTTLTTNAILEKKEHSVGMIVSAGPGIDPEFFRTGKHYYPVGGSIDHQGREVAPIDEREIRTLLDHLIRSGIRYLGVVGKFSVRNPVHEEKIRKLAGDSFEHIYLGHKVSGNLSFPRRISTTYLNATVYPIHRNFFESTKKSLEKKKIDVPIHILKADGGTMNLVSSLSFPGQSILSGPSASIMGAIHSASEDGETLVMDIGGTSTDIAILVGKDPVLEPLGINVGGHKTLIRSLATLSIGIGGDSFVRVIDGEIVIGPQRNGPAMAFGGPDPTPTDAMVVLGLFDKGDPERAHLGISTIAEVLGISSEKAAEKIFDNACSAILSACRYMTERQNRKPVYTIHELLEGHLVNPDRILVLGGPAPFFAKRLSELSEYRVDVVPNWEVANAIGAALARTTCEVSLFADTRQGVAIAPEEGYREQIDRSYSLQTAERTAFELLRKKAEKRGSNSELIEMEILENSQFNMVNGFYSSGKNMRVKVQVKPGLIRSVPFSEAPG